jgi:hypothetical protein
MRSGGEYSELTMRERETFDQEKEMAQMQVDYNLRVKEMELEVAKIEARWSVLFRIPIMIIKLPVFLFFGIALIVSLIVKKDLPDQFWAYLK